MEVTDKDKATMLALEKDIAGGLSVRMADDQVSVMMALHKVIADGDDAVLKVLTGAVAMYVAGFDRRGRRAFIKDFNSVVKALENK